MYATQRIICCLFRCSPRSQGAQCRLCRRRPLCVIAGTSGSFALHDRIMPALVLPGDVQLASPGEHQRAKGELARSRSKHEARECTPEPWSSASVPNLRSHQSTQCASHVQPFFFHGRLYYACSRTSDGGCKNISIVGSCIPASVRLRGHGLLSVSFLRIIYDIADLPWPIQVRWSG